MGVVTTWTPSAAGRHLNTSILFICLKSQMHQAFQGRSQFTGPLSCCQHSKTLKARGSIFPVFLIPLGFVNFFANPVDRKTSPLVFLSQHWAFIVKWHKGHLPYWRQKEKVSTQIQSQIFFFCLPKNTLKTVLLLDAQLQCKIECQSEQSIFLSTEQKPSLLCLLFHLFIICFILFVFCKLQGSVSVADTSFCLLSCWNSIYLLGLSQ